jgi:LuxR family maltose regulon positive regulatory protein
MINLDLRKIKGNIYSDMLENPFILATKLMAPQLKSHVLLRTRLIERLMKARDRKLIVVCADAGYGKTTLLAQFCAKLEPSYVYYNLDPGDNDSARFLIYLIRGFQSRFPGFGKTLPDLIAETREPEILIGALINEFTSHFKDDFYVLLDDYHCLQRNLEIAKLLDYLLRHIPSNLHLVIASRSRLPLNTHYYEAKGELMMLEKEQLRFTEAEIRTLFNTVHKLRVAEDDIQKVVEHSAGWITAVQLILQKIIARDGEPPDETIRSSLAAGAPVFDYFALEILEDHPPQIQDFLVRSSVLETIDPTVCDYLFQARNSDKLLEYVTQENVFISKVGRGFRFHPLFRDFLNRRLTSTYPAQSVTGLYRRLADYHRDRTDYQSAADNYLLASDFRQVAAVLTDHYPYWRDTGSFESYLALVDRIPVAFQDRYPALLVNKMHGFYGVGNINGILNNHEGLFRRLHREKDRRPLIDFLLLMSMIMYLVREYRKSLRFAQQAERLIPSRDRRRKVNALSRIGYAYVLLMDFGRARDYCERAVKVAETLDDPLLLTMARFNLAMYLWLSGDLRPAYKIFEQLIHGSMNLIPPFNRIRINLNAALLAAENNREPEAESYLAQAEAYMDKYPSRPLLMDLEYWKAQIRIWQDRPQDALASFEKALEISRSLGLRYPEYLGLIGLVQVYLIMGDQVRARTAMDRAESIAPDNLPVHYQLEKLLTRLSLEIDERRLDKARRTREESQSLVNKTTVDYHLVTFYGLLAYYHLEVGEDCIAVKFIDRTLGIGEEHGYDYAFMYDSRVNRRLLEAAVQHGIRTSYLTRLLPLVKPRWGRELLKRIQAGEGRYDLECSFFGPFTIKDARHRSAHPEWRTRNSKSLCAYLFWAGEKGCTKDQLINEYWPDQNLKRAGHSLQVEISALRNLLGRILNRAPTKDLIMYKQDRYWINPALVVKTDTADLESRLRQAERPAADRRKRIELLKQAAELCRPDFGTDLEGEWCAVQRDKYREVREKILVELKKLS